jgi:hypothetical protein
MAKIAKTHVADPSLPAVELKLGKKTLYLCFTYEAMALTEQEFRKLGQTVNVLHALDFNTLDASSLAALLYAALVTHQPETVLTDIPALIQFRYIGKIREALMLAFVASLADPTEDAENDPLEQAE